MPALMTTGASMTFLPGTGHKLFKAIRKSRTIDQYETAAAAALADVENALAAKPEEEDSDTL